MGVEEGGELDAVDDVTEQPSVLLLDVVDLDLLGQRRQGKSMALTSPSPVSTDQSRYRRPFLKASWATMMMVMPSARNTKRRRPKASPTPPSPASAIPTTHGR
ncbi:hypothetical protein ACX1DX_00035 [Tessaracoccus sp. Y36]